MTTRLKQWRSLPGAARSAVASLKLAIRLVRDPSVSALLKLLPIAGVAYVVSPLDFVPDIFPIVGQLDDLAIIMMAVEALRRPAPSPIVAHHESAIAEGRPFS